MVVRSRKRISRKPETWHFAYDSSDRLVDATSAERRWSYTYDAFGRRISKQRVDRDGLVVERVDFSWDGDRLIEQSRDTGIRPVETTTWEYLPGSWTPIAQTVNRAGGDPADVEFYAVVSDMIGKPTELMTPDGARVAWRDGESTLWGAPRRDAKSSSNSSNRYDATCPLRFPGQYADDETGLHYNRHRYYDPESARYTTGDPLGLAPAPDPHAYVPNPTIWADPLGLAPCDPASVSNQPFEDGLVYRSASGTPDSLTPRPGVDMDGLSTFSRPESLSGRRLQIIDTRQFRTLRAIADGPDGHVSIAPPNLADLVAWAASRQSGVVHPYTQEVLDAIIGQIMRSR